MCIAVAQCNQIDHIGHQNLNSISDIQVFSSMLFNNKDQFCSTSQRKRWFSKRRSRTRTVLSVMRTDMRGLKIKTFVWFPFVSIIYCIVTWCSKWKAFCSQHSILQWVFVCTIDVGITLYLFFYMTVFNNDGPYFRNCALAIVKKNVIMIKIPCKNEINCYFYVMM